MMHKFQCDSLGATLHNSSTDANGLGSFSKSRCNTASHGDSGSMVTPASAPLNDSPALQSLHHGLPLAALHSWKLYENPFFVDGKLVNSKYVSCYLKAPLNHAANSFTSSASKGSQDNALALLASNENGSLNSNKAHSTSLLSNSPSATASARIFSVNVLNSAFWQHHELHRVSQAEEALIPSDLVNQAQPLHSLPCVESIKCPSLHLDFQIPNTNVSGEEHQISYSKANMAACSIQTTLATILQRLRSLEENQARSNAVIAKLRLEMEDGSSRIRELEFSHESVLREINCLLHRFGEQIATSRRKEQEKLRAAFVHLREEIEEERNTCRMLKQRNKKLIQELEEANIIAADTGQELNRERQARELMEEVCNELAREIGEDKAEVEQLKQEQAKSRQIVEEELKLIRMASLWRDERVKAKLSQVQLELDDKRHVGMPLPDLKSRVEEFVNSVSTVHCESYKVPSNTHNVNIDDPKQIKMIEQAELPRQALELSMQPVADDGGLLHTQSDMDFKEEKIMTPIIEERQTHTDVCGCCVDKMDDYKTQSMRYSGDYFELQVRPTNSMPNYLMKPGRCTRKPRPVVGDGLLEHNVTISPQLRRHLISQYGSNVETQQERGLRKITLDTNYPQAAHHIPDTFSCEGDEIEQSPPTAVPVGCSGELLQENDSVSESSNCTPRMKEMVHQKQLSLHFDGSEDSIEVREEDFTPKVDRTRCCSKDDSHVCMDIETDLSSRHQIRRGQSVSCAHMTKGANGMHLWKSPSIRDEHLRREYDGIDQHASYLKSLDGAESGEGEHDGFYVEPVKEDGRREDHGRMHHRRELDADGNMRVADVNDEHVYAASSINDTSIQHSKHSIELAFKSVLHDGGIGRTSARSSAKSSRREEAPPLSPPHKLVLPTPNAIRAPLVKTQYTSPRSVARSLSPSKPQVLQCFRPSPLSPEHNSATLAGSVSSKDAAKGDRMSSQHMGGSGGGWASKACLLRASSNNRTCGIMHDEDDIDACSTNEEIGERGQGKDASQRATEEEKGNSLRSELLKARELDLQKYSGEHGNASTEAAATSPAAANKSSSSSFRFSPIRRSLTSTSGR